MSRIRVLQVGKYYHPYIGGAENHLLILAQELKKDADINIIVANTCFKTTVEDNMGLRVFRLACLGSIFSLPLTLSLPFWLRKQKADILHFHLPNPLSVLSYLIARPGGKLVVSYHSDISRQKLFNPLLNPMLKAFLKKASSIVVSSQNLIDSSPVLGMFREKCRVVPFGINMENFRPEAEVLRKAQEIRRRYDRPLVLFVGRLVYYKGLEYLLAAMKAIDAKLMIVGDGPLKNRLKSLARCLGVEDKIAWIGSVENEKIAPYYYACDVFVLPSSAKSEGFGIVQLEAFACRKPVVSTDLPTGVVFVNRNGETGIVVRPCDPADLARGVNKLLGSRELRLAYGRRAREVVEKEFIKEEMAKSVMNIYKEVV